VPTVAGAGIHSSPRNARCWRVAKSACSSANDARSAVVNVLKFCRLISGIAYGNATFAADSVIAGGSGGS
jgi:hypothetical protein